MEDAAGQQQPLSAIVAFVTREQWGQRVSLVHFTPSVLAVCASSLLGRPYLCAFPPSPAAIGGRACLLRLAGMSPPPSLGLQAAAFLPPAAAPWGGSRGRGAPQWSPRPPPPATAAGVGVAAQRRRRTPPPTAILSFDPPEEGGGGMEDLSALAFTDANAIYRLRQLQAALAEAVTAQRFGDAATLRDEIAAAVAGAADPTQMAVLAANDAFYAALHAGDAEGMGAVWAVSPVVTCAHPFVPASAGWEAVVDSWRVVFAMGRPTAVRVRDVRMVMGANLAVVTCVQEVETVRGGETLGGIRAAINLFQPAPAEGRWRMVHHHSSPFGEADVGGGGGGGGQKGTGAGGEPRPPWG